MRRADIDGEQSVEILDREVLDRSRLRDPGVGHQASRSPINHEPGRRACAPVGRDEIGRDGVGTAAGRRPRGSDRPPPSPTGKLRRPEVARRVSGAVRVNLQSSFALRWLFPRPTRFQEQFPNIGVRLSTTSRKLRYIGSAFDVGVRSAPEKGAGLRSEPLMADRRRPACSPELLRKRPVETGPRSAPSHHPALRDDAIFLVPLVVRGRRR
jgi:LysR substrate binding domain